MKILKRNVSINEIASQVGEQISWIFPADISSANPNYITDTVVAASASLTALGTPFYTYILTDQTISAVSNQVITNWATPSSPGTIVNLPLPNLSGFSLNSGVFTCTVAGRRMVFVNIRWPSMSTGENANIDANITRGSQVSRFTINTTTGGGNAMCTIMFPFDFLIGDQLTINAGNASLAARAVGGISTGSPEIVRSTLMMLKLT